MRIRNHHFVFLIMLLISALIWTQMVIFLLHELFGFNPSWGILQYCVAVLDEQTVLHQIVLVMLNLMIAYTFGMGLWQLGKQYYLARKWNKHVETNQHRRLTKRIGREYKHFRQEIVIVRDVSFLALTSGFFRPRIILSERLVKEFSDRELEAIVAHESSHACNYDPMFTLLVKIMCESMPFIPIMKRLSHYIDVWMELEADNHVIRLMNSRIELASVLLRCSKMNRKVSVGIGFADEAINYRLLRLIEPKRKIRVPLLDLIPLTASLVMIFTISSIIISGCT